MVCEEFNYIYKNTLKHLNNARSNEKIRGESLEIAKGYNGLLRTYYQEARDKGTEKETLEEMSSNLKNISGKLSDFSF